MTTQIPGLYIMETEEKGRGVYTSIDIQKGDMIESAPVIVLNDADRRKIHRTKLHDYYFLWRDTADDDQSSHSCAIALGNGSIYNHSESANADFTLVYNEDCIEFVANRDIEAGEEITINYQAEKHEAFPLWF